MGKKKLAREICTLNLNMNKIKENRYRNMSKIRCGETIQRHRTLVDRDCDKKSIPGKALISNDKESLQGK